MGGNYITAPEPGLDLFRAVNRRASARTATAFDGPRGGALGYPFP